MSKPKDYFARSMSDAGLPNFTVTGGPFASSQRMGWHITTEEGFTVAVSCDARFAWLVTGMFNQVILSVLVEGHNKERLYVMTSKAEACEYVERLAGRFADSKSKSSMYVAHATIYAWTPRGRLRVLCSFDGHDRGDGLWNEWSDEEEGTEDEEI
jgi:hypothetical protein